MKKKASNYRGIKTLEVLEGADNYNAWIASRIGHYIKSPALEIGAGIGNISDYFKHTKELVLTDIDSNLVKHLEQKFLQKKNVKTEELDIESNSSKISHPFNTVYSVNVLEHIKDDDKALKNMNRLLLTGGRVVLLVPAKKRAFRKLDKHLGHFRRYEKEELRKKLIKNGFEVEDLSYFNLVGLFSWIVRDFIGGDQTHLKPSHVKIFDLIVPLLRIIEPKRVLPIGISLIAVGKKI